jgi:hypothetical protein
MQESYHELGEEHGIVLYCYAPDLFSDHNFAFISYLSKGEDCIAGMCMQVQNLATTLVSKHTATMTRSAPQFVERLRYQRNLVANA